MIQLEKFMDRWGNLVGQYAFARAISHKLQVALETPSWVGQEIFDINDPPLSCELPSLGYNGIPETDNVSFYGHYQFQRAVDVMSRSSLREWLKIKPELMKLCPKPKPFYIACHIRRGDYAKHYHNLYAVIDKSCYQKAVSKNGYHERDVIWFAEEIKQPGCERIPEHIRFVYDFILMMQADVIFRGNSTYSYWASVLSNAKVFSPLVEDKIGFRNDIPFVEGFGPALFDTKNISWVHQNDTTMNIPE